MDQEVRNTIKKIWEMKRAANGLDYAEAKERMNEIDKFIEEFEEMLDEKYGELGEGAVDVSGVSPGAAALTVWRVCNRESRKMDQQPAWEVFILTPEDEAEHFGHNGPEGAWRVCWESGPYEWGISLSNGHDMRLSEGVNEGPQVVGFHSDDLLVEPYYRFDLCFRYDGSRRKVDASEEGDDKTPMSDAVGVSDAALGNWIAGVDTKAIFNEMVLTAENDGAAYRSDDEKRKKRGAKRAAKEATQHMMKRFREMLQEVEPLVAEHVEEKWSGQE